MKILFLHLSDLHLKKKSDINAVCTQEIASALSSQSIGRVDKVFILVTGDIAFSGQIAQYLAFNEFKKVLVSSLKKKGLKGLFHIFIVPGNHDIDYSYIKDHDREYYENYIESKEDICDDTNEISARTQFLNYSGRNHGIHSHNPLFVTPARLSQMSLK